MIPEIEEYLKTLKLDKSPNTIFVYTKAIEKFVFNLNIQSIDDLKNVTPAKCREHQTKMLETISRSSVNTNVRPVRAMYNWMIENEYLDSSPWHKVKDLKTQKTVKAFLSEEEIDKMIAVCKNAKEKLMVAMLITTGLRRGELSNLKLSDIYGDHIVVNGKGNKQRRLILQPDVKNLLEQHIAIRNKKYGTEIPYLFVTPYGTQYDGNQIYRKVKSILQRTDMTPERIEEIHTHSLRHTFVANLFESGADIYAAQAALGHQNLATTQLYAHLRNSALDAAMLKQKPILGGN